jgi:hypothetical protein
LNNFIESYYEQVFHSVARLARLTDDKETDALTREILTDLWQRRASLDAESHKGVFIYKIVLVHVFAYLRARGEEETIGFLQKILLIDPANYTALEDNEKNPLPGASPEEDVGI